MVESTSHPTRVPNAGGARVGVEPKERGRVFCLGDYRTAQKQHPHLMDQGRGILQKPAIRGAGSKEKCVPLGILRNLGWVLASPRSRDGIWSPSSLDG